MSEDTMSDDTTPNDHSNSSGFPRWLKWGLFGALGILIVGYGLIFLYAKVINDSPDELDESDLDAALAVDGSDTGDDDGNEAVSTEAPAADPPSETADTLEPPATAPATTAAPDEPADTSPPADGALVFEATGDSELGYRVTEVLFGVDTDGVGRTNQITGTITIDGTTLVAADFEVDVASITSDDSRRDGQFRGRIMSTDEFPTATFTLTEPIDLGVEPVDGANVETTAVGELTLRGVTNSVTFELTARQEGERVGVLGNIPIVFADYSIANPSVPGITTEDEGLLEFVLVFEPAA